MSTTKLIKSTVCRIIVRFKMISESVENVPQREYNINVFFY